MAVTPLRVGLYTSTLPDPDRKPGGADVYVDRLAERLSRRGHHVVVFTYSTPIPGRPYRVRTLEPGSDVSSRLRRMVIPPARLNALDTRDLDVLHLHGDDWFYVNRRVPTVRTFHGSALYEARHASRFARRVAQSATYALELISSRLATSAHGVTPRVGPGYRTAGHLPLSIELPAVDGFKRPQPPTVLFVGTWGGRKRGALLHRQFVHGTLPLVPDARLIMVSDRCEPGPGVVFAGRPSDDELARLYREAWVVCLPSSYEGFGLPYLEAMAQGTPAVATSNPGSRFVLGNGDFGRVVADEELGRTLAELLLDEPSRVALARTGRERAEQFSWEDGIDRHERAYRAAIHRFRTGRGNGAALRPPPRRG